ncbi:hypothetical protein [Synechococcus sp. RedBA-s]|nr:hypothetical protein [Synechococcus sp. RedBA-s]MCP9800724.1 hypothetical protein [Synechococcus sp. RedBA-s]
MSRLRLKQRLSPGDLAFLEWLRPILLETKRDELEHLMGLPDPALRCTT